MQLTLVVPDLLDWSPSALAAAGARAPTLTRVLASADGATLEHDGPTAVLCTELGIAKQRDWPMAPWLARAAGLDPGSGYWLCAEPTNLLPDRDELRLTAIVHDLSPSEADALLGTLNAHFAEDGVCFTAPAPNRWFAQIRSVPELTTHPPSVAIGKTVLAFQPDGPDAGRWRRWQNEMQMLLFEHPVNLAREARGSTPVNSVWLWGGGQLIAPSDRAGQVLVLTADELVRELALAVGAVVESLPAALEVSTRAPSTLVWPAALGAPDAPVALKRVAALEREWMVPASRALVNGAFTHLALVIAGRALAARFEARKSSLITRLRQRLRPPQLSALLAVCTE